MSSQCGGNVAPTQAPAETFEGYQAYYYPCGMQGYGRKMNYGKPCHCGRWNLIFFLLLIVIIGMLAMSMKKK